MTTCRFLPSLTVNELARLREQWFDRITGSNSTRVHDVRFGQFLCNLALKDDQSFPELYYCEDINQAYNLALAEITQQSDLFE